MATLTTWMNNVRVGTLTRQANGAHSFRYDEEWLRSPRARPLSLSLPLQYGNITADAVYHYFDNLLPDSPQVRGKRRTWKDYAGRHWTRRSSPLC